MMIKMDKNIRKKLFIFTASKDIFPSQALLSSPVIKVNMRNGTMYVVGIFYTYCFSSYWDFSNFFMISVT